MNKIIYIIFFPLTLVCYVLLYLYRWIISPLLPHTCGYYPTCSRYMIGAIKEWGPFKGVWLGLKRLLRCNPKHKGGYDPVPVNIKGDSKWIF